MNKITLTFLFGMVTLLALAQQTLVMGNVKDAVTSQSITNATLTLAHTTITGRTDVKGVFRLFKDLPLGEQLLVVSKLGYSTKQFQIVVEAGKTVLLEGVTLERDASQTQDLYTVTLSEDQLNDQGRGADNISGLLAASLDVFQRTAAFEFSSSFFRARGLDSDHATVLINGIRMQNVFNGRPQWSHWGGLNSALRNRELVSGLAASNSNFGGVLGTTHINIRASQARKGAAISYASSNRSYTNRLMANYASGVLKNNWAYTLALGRRWGNEGFQDATLYDANSILVAVEKKISAAHSINVAGIYAPNRRGKASPNTQEVVALKGTTYNAYWGFQDGKKRNSRIKEVEAPIVLLNHYWNLSSKTRLNTNLAYQFGRQSDSRLDNNGTDLVDGVAVGGGANPSPDYYQNLPSYFERNFPEDLQFAFLALRDFEADGQVDWNAFYEANIASAQNGGNAVYALYEDRKEDKQLTLNTSFNTTINTHMLLDAGVNFQRVSSENYAAVRDLFGATQYLDVDQFAEGLTEAQNDLQNPNRLVREGDRFKYNYKLFSTELSGFAQTQLRYTKVDVFMAAALTHTTYQREGLYQNGAFPEQSLGKGEVLDFTGYNVKSGLTYKLSGKHLLMLNGSYGLRAPTLQHTFSNVRENHNIVPNTTEEKILSSDVSYVFRSALIHARLTGYHTKIEDANEVSFFFADGIGGDNVAFVQELLQGVDKLHIGIEFGIEAKLTPTLKLKGVLAFGQFTYANTPNLFLTTEADTDATAAGFVNGFRDFGTANLKDYKISAGPHRAYALGFEYRDPDYWWFAATANLFTHTYIDISPLTRSSNFTTDFDGKPFNDFDAVQARTLLQQERFKPYTIVNLVGGKSWKLGTHYFSVFASINNVLDAVFRTGGFEQGRNANFRTLRDDRALETPVFGAKYWYGRGATYFLNMNYRF